MPITFSKLTVLVLKVDSSCVPGFFREFKKNIYTRYYYGKTIGNNSNKPYIFGKVIT
jgi:hypothetical protein